MNRLGDSGVKVVRIDSAILEFYLNSMVLGVPSRTSTREVYDKLKWTNLRTKWKINRCLMVHKCLNSNAPEYICNHFTRSYHKHSTRTSTSGSVTIPALRTVQGQKSFGYTGSKDFNSLPLNLKSIKGALYRIQILCRRYTFWSYPAGLTIADPPG